MAMYIAQELAPKIFYFTYCLQEPENYIEFVEDSEVNESTNSDLIGKWEMIKDENGNSGYKKNISSDLTGQELPIDGRSLYIINSLKATILHCFGQYKIYNNLQEDIKIDTNFTIQKHHDNFSANEKSTGKYVAYLFINDTYQNGMVSVKNTKAIVKPEKASIVIAPSDVTITLDPNINGDRYLAVGNWI